MLKIIYPQGLLYFVFDRKTKYKFRKTATITKTKRSDSNPNEKIFRTSIAEKVDCVIG